jgi:PAS domain S-box-containing protein
MREGTAGSGEPGHAESDELFRLLFDQAPVPAVLSDLAFRFTRVNDAFCAMTGYGSDELATLTFAHISHPADVARDREALRRLDAGEIDEYRREKRYLRKDGGTVWGDLAVRRVVGADGRTVAHLALIQDITERKRSEHALRESETHFRSLVENLNDVFVRYDLDLRFTYVSPVIERVMGLRPGDLLGKTHQEAGFPDHLCEVFDDALRRALQTGRIVPVEFTADAPNGRIIAEARVFPEIDAWGEPSSVVTVIRDITDRKLAEDALRASEMRYRIAIENTYDWEWWEAPDGSFVYCSPGCEAVTGYGPEEFTQGPTRLLSITHPDDRDRLHDHLVADVACAGGPSGIEFRITAKDGSERVVEHKCRPVWGDDGTCLGRRGSNRDVTERRRDEEKLRTFKAMRDRAEEIAQVGSWRWDLGTGKATFSPELYRLFDVDPGETGDGFSSTLVTRVHPEDKSFVRDAVETAIDLGEPTSFEARVLRRDGTEHVVVAEGTLEADADGRPTALVGYCQDVTDQRRAEQTIRDAEAHYRSLFEQSPISIWEEDLSAVRDWLNAPERAGVTDWVAYFRDHPDDLAHCAGLVRVVDVNRASLDVFGASSRDDFFRHLDAFFDDDARRVFADEIAELAGGATRYEAGTPILGADGRRRILKLRLSVVGGREATLERVLATFADVTATRRAEEEIRQLNERLADKVLSRAEQNEATTRELEAFAYSIAHDVRTPLRTIDGFSALVLEEQNGLSAEGREALRRVRLAAQRLGRLLDDLMDLSQVSRRPLERRRVDVTELAEQVGEDLAGDHLSRTVQLTVQPHMVAEADPTLLRLILRELLDNAWKFTAPHENAHVTVGVTTEDDEQVYFVRDDGVGFDTRRAEHLFGAFQRLHDGDAFPGDGIGLATVQRLVRKHGGLVWARSAVEEGATFYFTLTEAARAARETAQR